MSSRTCLHGTRLRHEDKGLCTLTEVAGNGSWVVRFEVSGDTHTYKPNAQHKLKVEAGQVKPAGVVVALEEGSQESSKPSRRAPSQARSKAAVFEVDLDATVRQVLAEHRAAILGNDALGRLYIYIAGTASRQHRVRWRQGPNKVRRC